MPRKMTLEQRLKYDAYMREYMRKYYQTHPEARQRNLDRANERNRRLKQRAE